MRLLDPHSLTGHTHRLYGAAWALCGSRDDAEDLVQETFARVLARPRLLRGEQTELAYLMRALRNTFFSTRRNAARRPFSAATLDEVSAPDPRSTLAPEVALEVGEVYEAIATLPEHYRLALVAVDMLGLSYREAGRVLGVREETITTRLFRAHALVARQLTHTPPNGRPASPGDTASEGAAKSQRRRAPRPGAGKADCTQPALGAEGAGRTSPGIAPPAREGSRGGGVSLGRSVPNDA